MKKGRLCFTLSLFCFIAIAAISFASLTTTLEPEHFHSVGSQHQYTYDSDVTVFGFKTGILDFFFLILIYVFAACVAIFIKFAAAGLVKPRLAIVSAVADAAFTVFGAYVLFEILADGIPMNPLTLWAAAITALPAFSLLFNIIGLKKHKQG